MCSQGISERMQHWLEAYEAEKGCPPRNALQLVAFARNRGGSVKYSEVCDALTGGSQAERSGQPDVITPRSLAARLEPAPRSPRDWRLLRLGVAQSVEEDSPWSSVISASENQSLSSAIGSPEAQMRRTLSLDQPCYRCDSPERVLQPAKLRYSWTVRGHSRRETKIELLYSRRTGKKQVLIDGKAVFKTFQQSFDWCWEHPELQTLFLMRSENGHHELFCDELPSSSVAPEEELELELLEEPGVAAAGLPGDEEEEAEPAPAAASAAVPAMPVPVSWREPQVGGSSLFGAQAPCTPRSGSLALAQAPAISIAHQVEAGPATTAAATSSPVPVEPVCRTATAFNGATGFVDNKLAFVLTCSTSSTHSGASTSIPACAASVQTHSTAASAVGAEGGAPASSSHNSSGLGSSPRLLASPRTPQGLGNRAASAPGLMLDSSLLEGMVSAALAAAVVTAPTSIAAPAGSMQPARSPPVVPRLVLPAATATAAVATAMLASDGGETFATTPLLPDMLVEAELAADGNAADRFVASTELPGGGGLAGALQFRHSRSTPIFAKVKEYLSAACPVTSTGPRRPVSTGKLPSVGANGGSIGLSPGNGLSSTMPVMSMATVAPPVLRQVAGEPQPQRATIPTENPRRLDCWMPVGESATMVATAATAAAAAAAVATVSGAMAASKWAVPGLASAAQATPEVPMFHASLPESVSPGKRAAATCFLEPLPEEGSEAPFMSVGPVRADGMGDLLPHPSATSPLRAPMLAASGVDAADRRRPLVRTSSAPGKMQLGPTGVTIATLATSGGSGSIGNVVGGMPPTASFDGSMPPLTKDDVEQEVPRIVSRWYPNPRVTEAQVLHQTPPAMPAHAKVIAMAADDKNECYSPVIGGSACVPVASPGQADDRAGAPERAPFTTRPLTSQRQPQLQPPRVQLHAPQPTQHMLQTPQQAQQAQPQFAFGSPVAAQQQVARPLRMARVLVPQKGSATSPPAGAREA